MQELDDNALLREYAERNSEEAFATLVARHVNKVYSVALRHTRNPHQAEEITQAVFVILAKKARQLGKGVILSGWLYQTARLTALTFIRSEIRRARREQEACMQTLPNEPESQVWPQIAPLLDAAMAGLNETDRQAVVLRYFDGKSMKEVGATLGTGEDAVKMRMSRAVEKLRRFFTKRGILVPSASLTAAISANSVQAAPVALANSVTAVAFTKGAIATASTSTLIQGALKFMAWTNAKTAIVVGAVILLAAVPVAVTVEKQHERKVEKMWRINKDLPTAQIDKLPPMFKMVPTKFNPPWINWNSGSNGDKFVGARAAADIIAAYAYGIPHGRIRFPTAQPTNRYDFVATMPHGNREALQRELKTRLGLVGHKESEEMDVLLLKVRQANAPGLKPAIAGKTDEYSKLGIYHSSNEPIDTGAPRFEGLVYFLEYYFGMPVIDQTGLPERYSMELRWKEDAGRLNPDGLKQSMLDRLGLELVPARMPVEFLVMDKVR